MTTNKAFKKLIVLISIFFQIGVNALPWKENKFQKMSSEVENCIAPKIPYKNGEPKKFPLVSHICGINNEGAWNRSFYIFNKKLEYFILEKPINLQKLKEATGTDFTNSSNGYYDTKLILQDGDRYAQLCFFSSLGGHDICEINMYIDLEEGKYTIPEVGTLIESKGDFQINSEFGYIYSYGYDDKKNSSDIEIRKIFSKSDKEIKVLLKGFKISDLHFLSFDKIQATSNKNSNKKLVSFDAKQLDD